MCQKTAGTRPNPVCYLSVNVHSLDQYSRTLADSGCFCLASSRCSCWSTLWAWTRPGSGTSSPCWSRPISKRRFGSDSAISRISETRNASGLSRAVVGCSRPETQRQLTASVECPGSWLGRGAYKSQRPAWPLRLANRTWRRWQTEMGNCYQKKIN